MTAKGSQQNGFLFVHNFYLVMNVISLPGEELYSEGRAVVLEDKYLTKEPWIEKNGMGYLSGEYH